LNRLVWPDDFDTAAVNEWVAEVCKAKTIEKNQPAYHYLARHRLGKVDGSNFTPNNACALLFAKDPQQIIPGCMVKFQRVDGVVLKTGKDRNVVKTRDITGTVPQVITGTWEFLETQLRTYSQRSTDGKFFPVPEYPSEAWHEVIVNACVHRSYSLSGANIFVRMYDDRLEVDSPGGFPACVTPKNIYEIHYRRNWWLMEAMTYLRYVLCENEGTKRIRQAMIDMGLPEPEFTQKQIEGALVRVTLKNNRDLRHKWVDTDVTDIVGEEMVGKLNDYQKRLVNFAAEHGKINISQAMNLMPKPRWHTAKRHLDKLCEMKILIHVSERLRDPSAYYTLTSKVHGETV
jgi:ATP-dependent DNA helicase RecG